MNPREAGLLLGGYATGTLTEAERQALFAAALEDQTLFDALADEEALRELLQDPAARAHLLAALDGAAAPRRAVPFWRRPTTMGLAATLLLAAGVGVALRRVPVPGQPAPAVEATPRLAAPQKPQESPAAPQAPAPSAPPKAVRRDAPHSPAPPPPPAPAAEAAPAAGASLQARSEAVSPSADQAKDAKAETYSSEKRAKTANAAGATVGRLNDLAAPLAKALPPPIWAFSRDPAGGFKLTVQWGPGGHLYLLHRGPSGVSVLEPISTTSRADGKQESRFAGTANARDALDLYLLPEAAQAPGALPAEGPVPGFRARVCPSEKKQP